MLLPSLHRNDLVIKYLIIGCCDDLLATLFANNNTRTSPVEVVHMPKTVDWQRESVNGIGEEIDDHPADMLPSTFENENDSLKTVNCSEHDDGDERELPAVGGNKVDEVSEVDNRCGKNESS